MTVVGEAGNGRDAVALARELKPDVVVMDLMMPKLDGAEATRQITEALPDTKVIILTSYGTSADLVRAISNGAVGARFVKPSYLAVADIALFQPVVICGILADIVDLKGIRNK